MNDHQARQQQLQAQQRRFLQALSAGQVSALDRFGQKMEAGQSLLFRPPFDLVYQIAGISPVLDPRMAPGLLAVTLTVTFPFHVQGNQPNPNAVIVLGKTQAAPPETPKPETPDGETPTPPAPAPETEPGPLLLFADPE